METWSTESGVYQIENQVNGKRYIGSAVNLLRRQREHLWSLRRHRHHNRFLQRSFDKYGEPAFAFVILEYVEDSKQLIPREQYFFDMLKPEYNLAPIAGSQLGFRHTAEICKKLSDAMRGDRNPFYGKHHSEETRRKISEAISGKRHPNYGKHPYPSAETRAKISEAQMGERNHNYGKHFTDEHRRKLSEARIGKRHSEETRRKMSEAHKAYWRGRRERHALEET